MKHAVVTGGAGFLGSHLCDRLLADGFRVTCIDNFLSGRRTNIEHLLGHRDFALVDHDICRPLPNLGAVDDIFHLASPASPPHYLEHPLETLDVGSIGTRNMLELARRTRAVLLFTSTSEVYGDPEVSPQPESYRGNVSTTGPRAVYDEAKRFSEALVSAYRRTFDVDVRIARIFNTYGPRLAPGDGRVISNFVRQALTGEPLTIYGDGSQTRSFCYVDDLIDGIMSLRSSSEIDPVNLGNPDERTVREVAHLVIRLTGSSSRLVHEALPHDDPKQRRPDITRARERLGWEPRVPLEEGLQRTIEWFREHIAGRQPA
ncbi:MAG TPA: UDP-glucuronic acid decarboxylase family protein [Actinomycetota bacterium]|nr:UDP-glucuronic acid decarboxylase family protein [Actinomycetota bacterium]